MAQKILAWISLSNGSMTLKQKLLIPALALFIAAQVSAAPILVGEFTPANAGDGTEKAAIRDVIDAYNATHNPDLSQLFGGDPIVLINGWEVFVEKTADVDGYEGADDKTLTFTAPDDYAEYYIFSKYGAAKGQNPPFTSALHYLLAGEVLTYNPNGDGAPHGLSHIAIWGRGESPGTSVPDSGLTVALLGASMMMLAFAKRRLSA
jgi:hypothetical protein